MYFSKDCVLSALMHLRKKQIFGVYCVGLEDLVHNLCGEHPDSRASENVKSALAGLERDGTVTLLRMDTGSNTGPILGIQLNQES